MTNEARLSMLWDIKQIEKVVLRFGRSLDTGEWADYRRCLTDPVSIDFERLTAQPEARVGLEVLTRWADAFFAPIRRHHVYTNFDIKIDGDAAEALVYMTARHWKPTDQGASTNTQYGWYRFELERHGEGWLINRIKHDFQWVEGNAGLFEFHQPALASATAAVFCEANFAAARDERARRQGS